MAVKQKEEQRATNTAANGPRCTWRFEDESQCEWILHPSWRQRPSDNFTVWVNDGDKWIHRHQSSEGARRLGSMTQKRKIAREVTSTELGALLSEVLRNPDDETLQRQTQDALANELGRLVAERGTVALQALQVAANIVSSFQLAAKKQEPPKQGSKCPTCNDIVGRRMSITVSPRVADRLGSLAELLEEA